MRAGANPDLVILAIAKTIEATFTKGDWLELGLRTGTREVIANHPRLLRSLDWGDPDYPGNVLAVIPTVLGDRPHAWTLDTRFPRLREVEKRIRLEEWLAANDAELHAELYAGEDSGALDQLHTVVQRIGLAELDGHAARIRRGLLEDPALAVGSSKELLESVLKQILSLHGTGPETKLELPQLRKRVDQHLGFAVGGTRGAEPGAEQRRKFLGSLAQIVTSTAELRNAGLGTGHGVSGGPSLDRATARLAVSAAIAAATFYLEADAESTSPPPPATPF